MTTASLVTSDGLQDSATTAAPGFSGVQTARAGGVAGARDAVPMEVPRKARRKAVSPAQEPVQPSVSASVSASEPTRPAPALTAARSRLGRDLGRETSALERRRATAEILVQRAQWLLPADAALVRAVYGDGLSVTTIAALRRVGARPSAAGGIAQSAARGASLSAADRTLLAAPSRGRATPGDPAARPPARAGAGAGVGVGAGCDIAGVAGSASDADAAEACAATAVRSLRRRLRRLVSRVTSRRFVGVMRQRDGWSPTRRRVATACVLEGLTMREASARLGVSYHVVRRHMDAVAALCDGE